MFYLDTPVRDWLEKHPALKCEYPLCDCNTPNIVPFKTKKSVGIVCRGCNSGSWIRANKEDNQKLLDLLY
jgi:hypothetical protein